MCSGILAVLTRHLLGACALLAAIAASNAATPALELHDDVRFVTPRSSKVLLADRQTGAAEDFGNVTVMEIAGDYAKGRDEPRREVAVRFYETHGDAYDFLVVFTTFEFETGGALAFYNGIRNDTVGLGSPLFDVGNDFGSAVRLQGYIDMAAMSRYAFSADVANYHESIDTLAHEVMHRWAAKVLFSDSGGNSSADLLGRDAMHWSYFLDTDASLMYGSDWQAQSDGTFRSVDIRHRYGPLDLYLAGFAAASEVPPLLLIRSGTGASPGDLPVLGATTGGVGETVSIEQIIDANGARLPSVATAQKDFNAALVLLKRPGEVVPEERLLQLERFRTRFQQQMAEMTDGRAAFHIFTQQRGAGVGLPQILQGSGTTASPGGLPAAIRWLEARQDADGHWQDRPATAMRDTVAVVRTLEELDPTYSGLARARAWMADHPVSNLDQRSWRFVGARRSDDLDLLVASQDIHGGFGIGQGWTDGGIDTAVIATALADGGNAQAISAALHRLGSQQNVDGSLGVVAGASGKTLPTLRVANLFWHRTEAGSAERMARASSWIDAHFAQGAQTGWQLSETVDVYASLGRLPLSAATNADVRAYVRQHQQVDGDWGGSIYVTATAALAYARDQRPNLALRGELVLYPERPYDGERVLLRSTVVNSGNVPVQPTVLRWFDGDPDTGGVQLGNDVNVPELSAGSATTTVAYWDTTGHAGTHELWVVLDAAHEVVEASEQDNRGQISVTVAPPSAQPDLAVSVADFEFDPPTISALPGSVRLSGTVHNLGTQNVDTAVVRLYEQPDLVHAVAQVAVAVPARNSTPISFDFSVTRPANLDLLLRADPDGAIEEAIESNNDAEFHLPFGPSLDLELSTTDLTLVTASPVVGRPVEFDVALRNRGTLDSPPATLRAEVIQDGISTTIFEAPQQVGAGLSIHRRVAWQPERSGAAQLLVTVDPANQIAEGNELNNSAELAFVVGALEQPDLTFSGGSFQLTPTPGLEGQPLAATLGVRNLGPVPTGSFRVSLYSTDPGNGAAPIATTVMASMVGLETITATIEVPELAMRGDQRFFAMIDADEQIAEADENNNVVVQSLHILSKPDLAITVADIALSPPLPVPGQAVQARVTVRNLGGQDAHDVVVRLLDGDETNGVAVGDLTAGDIAAGASATLLWNWSLSAAPQARSITAVVDPDGHVAETTDANNVATLPYDVQDGDFFANERYISPNGDGIQDVAIIVFRSNMPSDPEVDVVNGARQVVRRYPAVALNSDLRGQVLWDGRDDRGRVVPDGEYRVSLGGANQEGSGEITITVDNDRSSFLEAVGTPYGIDASLPWYTYGVQIPPANSPVRDQLVGFWNGGLNRTNTLSPQTSPILTKGWVDAFAQAQSFDEAALWGYAFSPDGGDLAVGIATHRFALDRFWVFLTAAERTDSPRLVASFDGQAPRVLGYFDADTLVVGPFADQMLQIIDLRSGDVAPLRRTESSFGVPQVIPAGILWGYEDQPVLFEPRDAQRPVIVLRPSDFQGLYQAQLSPTMTSVVVHMHDRDRETVELVDLTSGSRTTLAQSAPGVTRGDQSGDVGFAGPYFGVGWLEKERQLLLLDATTQTLHVLDEAGMTVSSISLPLSPRIGDYAVAGSSGNVYPETFPRLFAVGCQDVGASIGVEHRIFDPSTRILHLGLGESVARDEFYENSWTLVSSTGISDYFRASIDGGAANVIQRGTLLPLSNVGDAAQHPLLERCLSSPPPDWPALMLSDGARLRSDGHVQTWSRGVVSPEWMANGRRVNSIWPDETRALHDSAVFSSLLNMSVVLQARTLGRGIELTGIAADRNFANYKLDWALIERPNEWHSLAPATTEQIFFEEFLTWVPPTPGTFIIRLTVTDRAGNSRSSTASASSFERADIDHFSLSGRHISPNGDGLRDRLEVRYNVLQPTTLEIDVADEHGNSVRSLSLTYGSSQTGPQEFDWDGRNNAGTIVSDGRYRFSMGGFAVWVVVDTVPPGLAGDLRRAYSDCVAMPTCPVTIKPSISAASGDRNPGVVRIESVPLTGGNWAFVADLASLPPGADIDDRRNWTEVSLSGTQYAGKRFRILATDLAGNSRSLELGSSEEVLALVMTGSKERFWHQPPPFSLPPDLTGVRPLSIDPDNGSLLASNMAINLASVSVEAAPTDDPGSWTQYSSATIADVTCSAQECRVGSVPLNDLRIPWPRQVPPGGMLVRLRGERADGSRVYSNQGYVRTGWIGAPTCVRTGDRWMARAHEYVEGRLARADLHMMREGGEVVVSADEIDDSGILQFANAFKTSRAWVAGQDELGHTLVSEEVAFECEAAGNGSGQGLGESWHTKIFPVPVINDECDGRASNQIALNLHVYRSEFSNGEPKPRHVRLSYLDGFTGQSKVLMDQDVDPDGGSAGSKWSYNVSTQQWPEGEYEEKLEVTYIDGTNTTKVRRFPVVREAPEVAFAEPREAERVCFLALTTRVKLNVSSEGSSSWRLGVGVGAQPTGFSCLLSDGETSPLEDERDSPHFLGNSCPPYEQVGGFGGAYPGEVDRVVPQALDNYNGMATFQLKGLNWSGGTTCARRTVYIDSLAEFSERAPPEPLAPIPLSNSTTVVVAPNGAPEFRSALFRFRSKESVHILATLHHAHVSEVTNDLIIESDRIGTVAEADQVNGPYDISWDGRIDGAVTPDGLYALHVEARDDCGHVSHISYGVLLDASPPIVELTAPSASAPIEAATVEIVGRAFDNIRLARWSADYALPESPDSWQHIADGFSPVQLPRRLGSWSRGSISGYVDLRLSAIDAVGLSSETHMQLQFGQPATLIGSAELQPALFSPNGDGVLDASRFGLVLLRAATVETRVLDASGSTLATVQAGQQAAGNHAYVWGGLAASGDRVSDGTYRVVAMAADGAAQETVELQTTVDTIPPIVQVVQPAGPKANPASIVKVHLADDHFATFEARLTRLGDGAVIASTQGNQGGDLALASLSTLPEGRYAVHVAAVDGAGNATTTESEFSLDANSPVVALEKPSEGALIPSIAPTSVVGSVSDDHLASYSLAFAEEQGDSWTELRAGGENIPLREILAWSPNLPDGRYRLRLRAIDEADNVSDIIRFVEVDGTPPIARIDMPAEGGVLGHIGGIDGRATDAHFAAYRLSIVRASQDASDQWSDIYAGTTAVDGGRLATLSLDLPEDDYLLRLVVTDQVGLDSTSQIRVRVDAQPPPAPLNLTGHVVDHRHVVLDWSAVNTDDLDGYCIYRGGTRIALVSPANSHYVDEDAPEGRLHYQVRSIDRAENESGLSNSVTLVVDHTPPIAQIAKPIPAERVRGQYDVMGTAYSNADFQQYRVIAQVSGRPVGDVELASSMLAVQGGRLAAWDTLATPFQDGDAVHLRLEAEDASGNIAATTVDVVIDNVAPAAPSGLVANLVNADSQVRWNANVEDDLLGYLLYRDNRLVNAREPSLPADLRSLALPGTDYLDAHVPDGNHTYVVYAIDRAGNVSQPSDPTSLEPVDNAPPSLTIESPADGARFERSVTILATSGDTDIADVRFSYRAQGASDWLDVGAPLATAPYRATWTPSPDVAHGSYELRALGRDIGGRVDPAPPIVRVVYADLTPPSAPGNLVAHADGDVARLSWNASNTPDLAGYRIYRDSNYLIELPAGTTTFEDIGLIDARYAYTVTSLDTSANESALSNEAHVRVFGVALEQPFTPTALDAIDLIGHSAMPGNVVLRMETEAGTSERAVGATSSFGDISLPHQTLDAGDNHFTVRVTDAEGNVSRAADLWMDRGYVPAVPVGALAMVDDHRVELRWEPNSEPDLLGYRVYRNGQPLAPDRLLGEPTVASGTGDPGAAVDGDLQTYWEAWLSGGGGQADGNEVALELSWGEQRTVTSAHLVWASAGMASGHVDIDAWSGHAWIRIARVQGTAQGEQSALFDMPYRTTRVRMVPRPVNVYADQLVRLAEIQLFEQPTQGATSAADAVTDGIWRYQVSATSTRGFESNPSAALQVGVGDTQGPEPVVLDGDVSGGTASLSWTASASSDVARYVLERDGEAIASIGAEAARVYSDAGLTLGAHVYVVRAYDGFENQGPPSNTLTLTITGEGPGVPAGLAVIAPPSGGALDLTWQAGVGAPAVAYRVNRGPSAMGPFEFLVQTEQAGFHDAPLSNGTAYYYTVEAYDSAGNPSGPGQPVGGIPRDRIAPAPPRITYPTWAGETATTYATGSDVCGATEPGATVDISRNGAFVASSTAAQQYETHSVAFVDYGVVPMLAASGAHVASVNSSGVIRISPIDGAVGTYTSEPGTRLQSWSTHGESVYYVSGYPDEFYRWEPGRLPERLNVPIEGVTEFVPDPRGSTYFVAGTHADDSDSVHGVWLVEGVSGTLRRIGDIAPETLSLAQRPRWSPDGARVLFFDVLGWLHVIDAVDASVVATLPLGTEAPSAWLRDSQHIIHARANAFDGDDLYVFDIQTQIDELLQTRIDPVVALAASIGDNTVAALGQSHLEAIDVQTGVVTPITSDVLDWTALDWTASGRIAGGNARTLNYIDPPGWFCARTVPLQVGTNRFVARATDAAGNHGFASRAVEVNVPADGAADLAITASDLFVVPTGGTRDEDFVLIAALRNKGTTTISRPELAATLIAPDGHRTALEAPPLPPLNAGESISITYQIGVLAQTGTYRVDVVADPFQQLRESDELNNAASTTFAVSEDGSPLLDLNMVRTVFAPGETVVAEVGVTTTTASFSGHVHVVVEDANGVVVAGLGDRSIDELDFGRRWSADITWGAQGVFGGEYRLRAQLVDAIGTLLGERTVPFTIDTVRHVQLTIAPEEAEQVLGRLVVLHSRMEYGDGNSLIDGAILRVVALDAAGIEVWRSEQVLGTLLPGYELTRDDAWSTAGLAEGLYTLRLDLVAPSYTESSEASVRLAASQAPLALVGSIMLIPSATVVAGQSTVLRARVSNTDTVSQSALQTRLRIIAEPGHTPVNEIVETFDLGAGEARDLTMTLTAPPLDLKGHVAVLEARLRDDAADEWRPLARQGFAVVDALPPSIAILVPQPNNVQPAVVPFSARIVDLHSGVSRAELRVDDGTWQPISAGADGLYARGLSGLVDGAHSISVRARDSWGNESTTAPLAFTVDATPPSISITGIANGDSVNHAVVPLVTITESNLASSDMYLDGTTFVSGTEIDTEGVHVLVVRAVDGAGNRNVRSVRFVIDRTSPPVTIVAPVDGSTVGDSAVGVDISTEAFAIVAVDNGNYHVQGSADAQGNAVFDGVPLVTGANTILATARDAAGNVGGPAAVLVVYAPEPVGPLEGSLQPQGAELPHDAALRIRVTLRNPNDVGRPAQHLRVRVLDAQSSPLAEQAIVHDFAAHETLVRDVEFASEGWPLGTSRLELELQQGAQWIALDTREIDVVDRTPPLLSLLSPAESDVLRDPVVLLGEAHDALTGIAAVEASVDDGDWLTMPSTDTDQYASEPLALRDGEHEVTLRATDGARNVSSTTPTRFAVDTQPPLINIAGVGEAELLAHAVTPTVSVSDPHLRTSEILLNGLPFVSGTTITESGDYRIDVRAVDSAGNEATAGVGFTLDLEPPLVTFLEPAPGAVLMVPKVDVLGYTEASALVHIVAGAFSVQSKADADGRFQVFAVPLQPGSNELVAQATDQAGNVGPETRLEVTYTPAPSAGVAGRMEPFASPVPLTGALTVAYHIQNTGDVALPTLSVRLELRAATGLDVLVEDEFLVDLPIGGQAQGRRELSTLTLDQGDYELTLSAVLPDPVGPVDLDRQSLRLATVWCTSRDIIFADGFDHAGIANGDAIFCDGFEPSRIGGARRMPWLVSMAWLASGSRYQLKEHASPVAQSGRAKAMRMAPQRRTSNRVMRGSVFAARPPPSPLPSRRRDPIAVLEHIRAVWRHAISVCREARKGASKRISADA